jgi:hypothetical protein
MPAETEASVPAANKIEGNLALVENPLTID